ncbi:uncharacterized protein L201_006877 [Kwoniella dendrophila CBS 6074]|uniref:SCA7 domain-containing protein n=1 Tax=Kwoniella dendrophila CBS 6074 TaxID=1295534 RepID=A0AAX4K578_9TREE
MTLKLKPRNTSSGSSSSPLKPFTFELKSPSPPTDLGLPLNENESLPPIPPASFIPEKDMYMFGTFPLKGEGEMGKGIIKCKKCGKNHMEWSAGEHKRICNHILEGTPLITKKSNAKSNTTSSKPNPETTKKRRASEVSNPTLSPKKRTKLSSIPNPNQILTGTNLNFTGTNTSSSSSHISNNKERDRDNIEEEEDDDEIINSSTYKGLKKNEIKKIEKEKLRLERKEAKEKERFEIAERKRIRATNPIDLDKQCGVINDKLAPCARSLTCKTHTVGAKRAVQGRTKPYDELYIEWQRIHNPNFKEPQKRDPNNNASGSNGLSLKEKERLKKKKKAAAASANASANSASALHRRSLLNGNSEKGLDLDDEDDLKEFDELINLTKSSNHKVKNQFYNLGFTPTQTDDKNDKSANTTNTTTTLGGSLTNPSTTTTATTTNGRPSISGPTTSKNSQSRLNNLLPSNTNSSSNNGFIPFQTIWKSSSVEFNSVGQLLTKALAARSTKHSLTNLNKQAAAAAAASTNGQQSKNGIVAGNGVLGVTA